MNNFLPIILTSNTPDIPVMTVVIWIIILLLVFFARNFLGRTIFGIIFGVSFLFFSIFMIDNYTGHNLRNYIDITFYDKTLEDPQGVAEDLVDKATKGGEKANKKLNDVGSELDKKLGIDKEKNNGKVWVEDSSDTDKKSNEKLTDDSKEQSTDNSELDYKKTYEIEYKDISRLLNNELSELTKEDKEIIKSLSPTVKSEFEGKNIIVTNKEKGLFENNKLKIYLYY